MAFGMPDRSNRKGGAGGGAWGLERIVHGVRESMAAGPLAWSVSWELVISDTGRRELDLKEWGAVTPKDPLSSLCSPASSLTSSWFRSLQNSATV